MKIIIKTLNTALLFSLFLTINVCNGQSSITLPKGVNQQTMFRCSMKDKAGNLWFGTTGAGIYKYDGKLFTRYAENEGLSSTLVYSIAQDIKGSIWVATNNGIFYNKGSRFNRLEIPELDHSNSFSSLGISNANSPLNRKLQVYCVVCDKKGNIWFGTENQGLWRYNGTNFTNFRCADSTWIEVPKGNSYADYKQNGFVQSLLKDKKGNIWVSSFSTSLNYYDGKTFHKVTTNRLSRAHTFQMMEDKLGNIWMATRNDAICRFNGKTIESFIGKEGIHDNSASCLYEAQNGNVWFGSLGISGSGGKGVKGITIYDGKSFTPISSKGMRNNEVWTVIEDNSNNIWIGTKEFGLFRYNGKSFTEFTTLNR